MSETIKLGELEVEVLDLTRRLDRIEGDQSKFDSRLKNIEEQVTLYNSNIKRFWERDWPLIENTISEINGRLNLLVKENTEARLENVEARIRVAVAAVEDKNQIAGLQAKTKVLEEELAAQRSVLLKLLVSAAGGGATIVAIVEGVQAFLGAP